MTSDPLEALRLPTVPIAPRPSFAADLLGRIQHAGPTARDSATVRYFADDLDSAVAFYRLLDFDVELRPSPAFAMLYRGDLRLLLSTPASHTDVDGIMPQPGGWNRISLRVDDLDQVVGQLRQHTVRFRSYPATGVGARVAVIEDPAGNPVELFEPQTAYHERTGETPS
jgi:catechol 2,3-dioxygenase-like lactoylglutathione lyase family enzyme